MKPVILTLTYEQRLDVTEAEGQCLDALMSRYQKLKRVMWQNVYGRDQRPEDMNAFKREFQLAYQISSTGYNSLKYDIDALAKAQRELNDHHLKELEQKEQSVSTWIKDKRELIQNSQTKLPKLGINHAERLKAKIDKTRFSLHHKSRKLAAVKAKIDRLKTRIQQHKISGVVFGGKNLFRRQHNLKQNGYKSHAEWKADLDLQRSCAVTFIGDQGESDRNREVKGIEGLLNKDQKSITLRITLPDYLRTDGKKYITLSPLDLTDRNYTALKECLETVYSKEVSRNGAIAFKEMRLPITYRFLKRQRRKTNRDGTCEDILSYYVQFIIQKRVESFDSRHDCGAIAIDQNLDCLAVGMIDRFGNPKDSFTIPFTPCENSIDQNKAIIGAMVADVVDLAQQLSVPIVIEQLDFAKKKAALKETFGPKVNRRFSAFSYQALAQALKSRCAKHRIELIEVNPAYTSMLGSLNYFSMRKTVSSHEAATFAIARRGLKFKDHLNFGAIEPHKAPGKLDENSIPRRQDFASYQDKAKAAGKSGHLWGFLASKETKKKFKILKEFYSDGNSWFKREEYLSHATNRVALGYGPAFSRDNSREWTSLETVRQAPA